MDKQSFMEYQGRKIKGARVIAKKDQIPLAEEIGICPTTLSRYENGVRLVPAYHIFLIAKATGQAIDFFFPEK